MNQIIIQNQNGQLTASSREIAENFGKRHADVLVKIDNLIKEMHSTENSVQYFIANGYKDDSGKANREYLVTRDGFTLTVMGFTGAKALEWKLKYIEAFNKMEDSLRKPKSALELVQLTQQALLEVNEKVESVEKDLHDFKMDMPILGIECDRITAAVKKKGVDCLGGKVSAAYQDTSIRNKVYSDIYRQLKREFAISSYKAIKRNQTDFAISIINNYRPPFALNEEIEECNRQVGM